MHFHPRSPGSQPQPWAGRDAARLLQALLPNLLKPGCSPNPQPKPQPLTKAEQRDFEISEDSPCWE